MRTKHKAIKDITYIWHVKRTNTSADPCRHGEYYPMGCRLAHFARGTEPARKKHIISSKSLPFFSTHLTHTTFISLYVFQVSALLSATLKLPSVLRASPLPSLSVFAGENPPLSRRLSCTFSALDSGDHWHDRQPITRQHRWLFT